MDVNGAKALKERLSAKGARKAPPAAEEVDVPADAPPVYHWLGVSRPATSPPADDDEPATPASLFRRLGLNFR